MTPKLKIWTDNVQDQCFLESILRHQSYSDAIEFDNGKGGTSLLSIGSSSILVAPERPIALVMNAGTDDPAEIADLRRIIKGNIPWGTWVAAIAVPNVDAWALADLRIERIFSDAPYLALGRYKRAVAMKELTKTEPFDVDAIRRINDDFRRLDDFLALHAGTSATVATRS